MVDFEDRVLVDEFGGGVVAIFSKGHLAAYSLGYSNERTIDDIIRKKVKSGLVGDDGQLYFDFMKEYF